MLISACDLWIMCWVHVVCMFVYIFIGVEITVLLCVHLLSHCWLDARGGHTGGVTDCLVVAGVAGLAHQHSNTQRSSPSDNRRPPWNDKWQHNLSFTYTHIQGNLAKRHNLNKLTCKGLQNCWTETSVCKSVLFFSVFLCDFYCFKQCHNKYNWRSGCQTTIKFP